MKKLNLISAIIISIALLSCSSGDDDPNNTNQNEIFGVWNLKSVENKGNDVSVIDCQTQQTITYNNDGSGSEFFPEEISQNPCEFRTAPFSWTRNENELILIVNEEGSFMFKIVVLTETQLQIVTIERNGVQVPEEHQEIFKYEK